MQYLLNQAGFSPYRFATESAKADAYSPFAHHINDIENKRSRLFPDRMRIPGRKTKYILVIAYLIHLYSLMKVLQAKKIYSLKVEQQNKLQRKAMPFFQSLQNVQYTIVKHRLDLLTKQVLGEEFLKKSHFHNPSIGYQDMTKTHYKWTRSGVDRYAGSMLNRLGSNYWNGFSISNI